MLFSSRKIQEIGLHFLINKKKNKIIALSSCLFIHIIFLYVLFIFSYFPKKKKDGIFLALLSCHISIPFLYIILCYGFTFCFLYSIIEKLFIYYEKAFYCTILIKLKLLLMILKIYKENI